MSERYQILVDQLMRQGMSEQDALACADKEFDVVASSHKARPYIGTFAWYFNRLEGERDLLP